MTAPLMGFIRQLVISVLTGVPFNLPRPGSFIDNMYPKSVRPMCSSSEYGTIEVWLYGKLRRFAPRQAVTDNSIVQVRLQSGDTIKSVLERLGIEIKETSNIFLNGELSLPVRPVVKGDRLGVFPDDMGLLYRQYFEKKGSR